MSNKPAADITLENLSSEVVHIIGPSTIIGRHEDCDLVLAGERGASRKHARVTIENGNVILMDLGSLNGTMINGREINRPVQLADGDIIIFDKQEYRLAIPYREIPEVSDNVTVIANKEEIGRPDSIKPAIRLIDPGPDDQEASSAGSWENEPIANETATPETANLQAPDHNDSQFDVFDEAPIPATSRPGGDTPSYGRRSSLSRSENKPILRWFVVGLCIILALLAALYFAYKTGLLSVANGN